MTFVAGGLASLGVAPWRVLAGADLTGGLVGFGDARIPPHTAGPGLHVHTQEDEACYVIAGIITFVVGDRTFEAGPETLVRLPRTVPHTFANRGDEDAWAVGVTSPAGIEAMFGGAGCVLRRISRPTRPRLSCRTRRAVRRQFPRPTSGRLNCLLDWSVSL